MKQRSKMSTAELILLAMERHLAGERVVVVTARGVGRRFVRQFMARHREIFAQA